MKTREKHADESYKTKNQKLRPGFMQTQNLKRLHNREIKLKISPALKTAPSSACTRKQAHKTGTRKGAAREKLSPPLPLSRYLQPLFSEANPR
ncbi:hypothetical protein [uncultured Rothia sp.]|uniref:hypothetical protein n=1 Tax=uncultured Rothia sp. TaxID=316088 RepID=UPI0028DB6A0D|nr:hypothetical protein [uncultured Rothia sp.]